MPGYNKTVLRESVYMPHTGIVPAPEPDHNLTFFRCLNVINWKLKALMSKEQSNKCFKTDHKDANMTYE